jgi:ribosome recycling factor
MDHKDIIEKIKPEMDKVISFLEAEMAKLRAGRASVALIEDIEVECFDQVFPLKQLGSITTSGPRSILIQPWDKSYLEPIQKALTRSSIGASPIADQDTIRLSFPPLSEEFRQDLLKVLSDKLESARKTIRHWRGEAWKEVQEKERAGEIREDDKFKGKDKLKELVDDYNKKIEEIGDKKKKEISE